MKMCKLALHTPISALRVKYAFFNAFSPLKFAIVSFISSVPFKKIDA